MEHATNAICKAIAIRTAHTSTIKQLFLKVCQKHCDGDECDKYIEIFTRMRRCLSTSIECIYPVYPLKNLVASVFVGSFS
jgi:hypothetical protein